MRVPVFAAVTLAAGSAAADIPVVVTDTPVVHSLVSQVMGDIGEPVVLLEPGADPHSFQLRPSQAAALSDAALVFWVGEELSPWLARALGTLSGDARTVALLDADGVFLVNYGDGTGAHGDSHGHAHAEEAAHDHDHDHDHAHEEASAHDHDHDHDHAHEEAAAHDHDHDHDHEEAAAHDHDHDHAHDEAAAHDHGHDHDHDHSGVDPHAWLYPDNAKLWLSVIAADLSAADPGNAATYAANAEAAALRIDAAAAEAAATLEAAHGKPIVVFHDAYGYFAQAFDIEIAGSIALGDAAAPGAQRIRELQERMGAEKIACVFREPQHDPSLAESIAADAGVGLGSLDPEGTTLPYGPDLYTTLLTSLATSIADCVSAEG
jgi:zinc transport system substrate-binding protein